MPIENEAVSKTAGSSDSCLPGALRERFGLTRMEGAVASALAEGLTYDEIAELFSISYHTVHSHIKAIHLKARVSSTGRLLAKIRKEL